MDEKAIKEEKKEVDPVARKKAVAKEIMSWVWVVLLAFLATIIIRKFVIVNAEVPTGSMVSLIDPGDRLIGFRLSYLFKEPQRFDVVIFKYPVDPNEKFIKRVIGLPGETVTIRDAKIYIDDSAVPLDEPYLPERWTEQNDGLIYEVPEDSYFLLGDNRNVSLDARYWANEAIEAGLTEDWEVAEEYTFVPKKDILGKAIFKYYPKFEVLNGKKENE
ncbi:MAG: signal peptidase I [Lachnospiraceae bacterium]|nr:signal peptidase I [Lachnospiraceae bacterium]